MLRTGGEEGGWRGKVKRAANKWNTKEEDKKDDMKDVIALK